ncbi:chemotaxis protein CheW [Dyella subtropica]|uniref:chemotaxis protein CheW n=1 Tax=Dyella subtropica TaxID=2992127 RepID=UPI0022555063|nr:chemotaxis protein CheW [Dyella subtropica]
MAALVDVSSSNQAAIHDCWNKIGVRGDGSCPALEQHVHCRNCPIYSAAASDLLNMELPAGHMSLWTAHVAQKQATAEATGAQSVVAFRVGAEWLALPTSAFKEIVGHRTIHSIPHRRNGVVLGLVNVRGELVVCASLTELLGLEPTAPSRPEKHQLLHRRFLVIELEGVRTAFPVDEVHGIRRFHSHELGEVPATVASATATYIKALLPWRDESIGLLDEQLLIFTLNRSLTLATT